MVHVVFDVNTGRFGDYFPSTSGEASQVGFGEFYRGFRYQRGYGQRGRGIGGILRTVWRFMVPILKDVGRTVGKEGMSTGARILENIAQGVEPKEAIVTETQRGVRTVAKQAAERLKEQSGSGVHNQFGNRNPGKVNKSRRKRNNERSRNSATIVGRSVLIPASKTKRTRVDSLGLY